MSEFEFEINFGHLFAKTTTVDEKSQFLLLFVYYADVFPQAMPKNCKCCCFILAKTVEKKNKLLFEKKIGHKKYISVSV